MTVAFSDRFMTDVHVPSIIHIYIGNGEIPTVSAWPAANSGQSKQL